MSNAQEKLELALTAIDAAIGELYGIDGMEHYCEQLGMLSAELDCELEELISLESK